MDTHTHLEDLSNEIFFEIFDYLHALDIFTGFALLNKRISSILQSIRLHVIILDSHYYREINFLSSHLTFHAHQVISLKCSDTIRDCSSIINFLFNRHHFINLQSCIFMSIHLSTHFENIVEQVKSMNRLVSFVILQPYREYINGGFDLIQTIFFYQSSLHSVKFHNYGYFHISAYIPITSNLISLDLLIYGKPKTVSFYSILPILDRCRRIRYLHVVIKHEILYQTTPPVAGRKKFDENNLPISPQLISFDLSIFAKCDIGSIAYILRCMPNLRRFKFLHGTGEVVWSDARDLINGYTWQQMFEKHVPFLSKFDFHMSIIGKNYPKLDLDMVINSFQYFVKKYSEWHMIVDRWVFNAKDS
ncbi:unnamed protein product, partial [Rotaria sordida]